VHVLLQQQQIASQSLRDFERFLGRRYDSLHETWTAGAGIASGRDRLSRLTLALTLGHMEKPEARQETLKCLQAFIDTQQALIDRTHLDLNKLAKLRESTSENTFLLAENLNDPAFKLSVYGAELQQFHSVPQGIDWELFEHADPSDFRSLVAKNLDISHPPSRLQSLVRDFRSSLLADATYGPIWRSLEDKEACRESLVSSGSEARSHEDIEMEPQEEQKDTTKNAFPSRDTKRCEAADVLGPSATHDVITNKVNEAGTKRKPRPETFNLPWTSSEQHLLEKLLEEIPAGEPKRWAKISAAMSGKRTPRQVASRVQKYFEKLKRFGVEIS